jgi:class 3 adenylate cyclase
MRSRFRDLVRQGDLGPSAADMEVQIGINTGPVVAGTVGSSLRIEYTALGDTVNIAARLEGVAKPGQIVIGPTTAKLVSDRVTLAPLGRIALKGRDEPVEVCEVPDPNVAVSSPRLSTDEQVSALDETRRTEAVAPSSGSQQTYEEA